MMNVGLDEGNESEEDEGESKPEKKVEYMALNPFKELYPSSDIVNAMREFGPNIVPLSMVGMMMNYAGNHLLHYIYTVMKKRIFYPMHKVVSI
jgi:hypothetical protein